MTERISVPDKKIDKTLRVVANKNVRNIAILIISTIIILALNSLIPMLYFEFGYTKGRTDTVTYTEYLDAKTKDKNVRLTAASGNIIRDVSKEYDKEWGWKPYYTNYNEALANYEDNLIVHYEDKVETTVVTDPETGEETTVIEIKTVEVPAKYTPEQALKIFKAELSKWSEKYYVNFDTFPERVDRDVFNVLLKEDMSIHIANTEVKYYTKFFFQDTAWYIDSAISIASAVILFYSMFNYLIGTYKERHEMFNALTLDMRNLTETALDPHTFEPWMENEFNRRRKEEQHVANVKYSLSKLERRTPARIKNKFKLYFKDLEMSNNSETNTPAVITLDVTNKLTFFEKRYIRKKENLLYLLSKPYIRDYVKDSKVKHFREISPIFVYSGAAQYGKTTDRFSLMQTDSERIGTDASKKIPIIILNSFLFALIIAMGMFADAGEPWVFVLMAVIARIVPLVVQVILSFDYTNNFMSGHLIPNLLNRKSIALLYLAEVHNGKTDQS